MSWPLAECFPGWLIEEAESNGCRTDAEIGAYCSPKMKVVDGVLCDPRISDEDARTAIEALIPIETRVQIEMLTNFRHSTYAGIVRRGVE